MSAVVISKVIVRMVHVRENELLECFGGGVVNDMKPDRNAHFYTF